MLLRTCRFADGLSNAGLDHTLITGGASVGVIGQKRPPCIYLESSTYDWFGLPRVGRNGFDSRWPTLELKRITPDRLCEDQKFKEARNAFRARIHRSSRQCQPGPPDSPTQLPTQKSYPWYSVPPILFVRLASDSLASQNIYRKCPLRTAPKLHWRSTSKAGVDPHGTVLVATVLLGALIAIPSSSQIPQPNKIQHKNKAGRLKTAAKFTAAAHSAVSERQSDCSVEPIVLLIPEPILVHNLFKPFRAATL
jgi:hypothetical protein